jgi:hypothetical protein
MKRALFSAVVAWLAVVSLNLTPAQAQQPTRVFIAAQGSDSNPCNFAQPCRSFQHAHDTVAAGGEIDVLDPADYGALLIGKAISIEGHGYAGLQVAGGANGITINAGASDRINLRGLLLDGLGAGNGGVTFNTGAALKIQDCVIRNFNFGIWFGPPSGSATLNVSDTLISDNSFFAIQFQASSLSPTTVTAVLDRVEADGNATGLFAEGFAGNLHVSVAHSVFSHNNNFGILAQNNGGPAFVIVRDSTISNNANYGIQATGSNAIVLIGHSIISGNGTGVGAFSTGAVDSYNDNYLNGNGTDGSFTLTIAPQ